MTIWQPQLEGASGPRYRALAHAIISDIEAGTLQDGARLPPQRDLAHRLGVTIGTVSRAYGLVEQRGLVSAEVGRGTFVRRTQAGPGLAHPVRAVEGTAGDVIDLTMNAPADRSYQDALAATLREVGTHGSWLDQLMGYAPRTGLPRHRQAASAWLTRAGIDVPPEQIILTGGAHQAIVTCLAALVRPGDVVLAEGLTYSGLRGMAHTLGLRIEAVALDEGGPRPDALDALCRQSGARVLFVTPTLHNPTGITLDEGRRRALVEVARRHDLLIIEDDVYGLLRSERPPHLRTLAPERTILVTSASKALAPGLRIGMLIGPEALFQRLADARYDLFLSGPALPAAVFEAWVADGTADRLLGCQRAEAPRRQALAAEVLSGLAPPADPAAFHLWLPLPPHWPTGELVEAAHAAGVVVAPGQAFAIGRGHAPRSIRLSLSAAPDHDRLRLALTRLKDVLEAAPGPRRDVI